MSRLILGLALGLAICNLVSADISHLRNGKRFSRAVGENYRIDLVPNAVLRYYGEIICGASFVTKHHAVTAAQCVFDKYPGRMEMEIADFVFKVAEVVFSPDFNSITFVNDVGILKPEKPIDSFVNPGYILKYSYEKPENLSRYELTAHYDKEDKDETTEIVIRHFEGKVKFVPKQSCAFAFKSREQWLQGQYCANSTSREKGEVIIRKQPGMPVLLDGKFAGMVSSSSVCGWDMPDIVTPIEPFIDWLSKTVENDKKWTQPPDQHLTQDELKFYKSMQLESADPEQSAFIASIHYRNSQIRCAGAMIDYNLIVTTAECGNTEPEFIKIEVGMGAHVMRTVEAADIEIHPNYSYPTIPMDPYNVAVIQLKESLFRPNKTLVKVIGLSSRKPATGQKALLVGFDVDSEKQIRTKKLELKVSPGDECEYMHYNGEIRSNGKICAKNRLGACLKQSGASLMTLEKVGNELHPKLAGLYTVMDGVNCADFRKPSVFVNLAEGKAKEWVEEKMKTMGVSTGIYSTDRGATTASTPKQEYTTKYSPRKDGIL